MALGRVSPFRSITRPTTQGENLNNTVESAPFEGPVVPSDGSGKSSGPGPGNFSVPNLTGFDPGLVSLGINTLGLGAGLGGLPTSAGGFLGGLVGRSLASSGAPPGVALGGALATAAGTKGVEGKLTGSLLGSIPSGLTPTIPADLTSLGFPNAESITYSGPTTPFGALMSALGLNTAPTFTVETPFGRGELPASFTGGNTGLASLMSSSNPAVAFAAGQAYSGNYAGNPHGHGNTPYGSTFPHTPTNPLGYGAPRGANDTANDAIPDATFSEPTATPTYPDVPTADVTANDATDGGVPGTPGTGPGEAGLWHEGGFVGLDQEGMGGDTRNTPDEGTKEVDATLEAGEFVVNKEAAGRFGPLLNKMNQIGRSQQLKEAISNVLEGAARFGFDQLLRR